MTSKELREKLVDEIQHLPEGRVEQIFDFIHFFRVGLGIEKVDQKAAETIIGQFAGCWSELPDDVYNELELEWQRRREHAFSDRREHGTDIS
jgi:hypothetical protein